MCTHGTKQRFLERSINRGMADPRCLEVPESAVRALSKRLKHYIDVQRREEGFDSSPSNSLMGHFSSGRGTAGTFHYNSLQDQHLQHYFQQPLVRKHLEDLGVLHPGMLQSMAGNRRMARSAGERQKLSAKRETERLRNTAARLLLTSEYCSYNRYQDSEGSYSSVKLENGSRQKSHTRSSVSSCKSRSRPPSQLSTPRHPAVNRTTTTPSTPLLSTPSRPQSAKHSVTSSNHLTTPLGALDTCSHSHQTDSVTMPYPPCKTADVVVNQSPVNTTQTISTGSQPVIRCSVGVGTVSSCEASTQTPVNTGTQTDLSKMLECSHKKAKRHRTRTLSRNDPVIDTQSSVS